MPALFDLKTFENPPTATSPIFLSIWRKSLMGKLSFWSHDMETIRNVLIEQLRYVEYLHKEGVLEKQLMKWSRKLIGPLIF